MIARNEHGDNGTEVGLPRTNGCPQVIRILPGCVIRLVVPPKMMSNKDLAVRAFPLRTLETWHLKCFPWFCLIRGRDA